MQKQEVQTNKEVHQKFTATKSKVLCIKSSNLWIHELSSCVHSEAVSVCGSVWKFSSLSWCGHGVHLRGGAFGSVPVSHPRSISRRILQASTVIHLLPVWPTTYGGNQASLEFSVVPVVCMCNLVSLCFSFTGNVLQVSQFQPSVSKGRYNHCSPLASPSLTRPSVPEILFHRSPYDQSFGSVCVLTGSQVHKLAEVNLSETVLGPILTEVDHRIMQPVLAGV